MIVSEHAMSAQPIPYISEDEYLRLERLCETKNEYHAGRIYAMAGASREHATISFNVAGLLHSQLRGMICQGMSCDMRVKAPESKFYAYPDVTVVCGKPVLEDEVGDSLLNPTLIVEVLSPSTERYDRGDKFACYRTIATLSEYILVSQDRACIERYLRTDDGSWIYTVIDDLSMSVAFTSIGCQLELSDVYDNVEFKQQ